MWYWYAVGILFAALGVVAVFVVLGESSKSRAETLRRHWYRWF